MTVMPKTTMSGREFNQDRSKAKRLADHGPVVITDRGEPSYVLIKYEDYIKLTGDGQKAENKGKSIAEMLGMDGDDYIEFEIPKLEDFDFKPVEFN